MVKITPLSTRERRAAGRQVRAHCPREVHAKVVLPKQRDLVAIIKASDRGRLPHLIPIRHGRMAQSPFAFFRGGAAIQAIDLGAGPDTGIVVQCCGDCHLVNFGGFATPERQLVFDINDFDETLEAPFEWDVKRMAASFVVAARSRDFDPGACRAIAVEAAAAYRRYMRDHADQTVLDAWYALVTLDDALATIGVNEAQMRKINKKVDKARSQTREHVFHKLTELRGGVVRIVDQPPLIYHPGGEVLSEKTVSRFLDLYRQTLPPERRALFERFRYVDAAMKVVGVGSVGTRCLIVLMMADDNDPLFLQVKEARASVLEAYGGGPPHPHNGERVVVGQRTMQSASDIFLGWSHNPPGRDFYIRQLRDMKMSADVESQDEDTMRKYASLCGMTLGRAHAKSGWAAGIAGYLGKSDVFDEAIGDYAVAYADQNERDYKVFLRAIRSGKLKSDLSPSDLETAIR